MAKNKSIKIIGAGLAGSEAAWQAAQSGIEVTLIEMRPVKKSPAHSTSDFGELVCSNSFGSLSSDRAAGLLQAELRCLDSIVMKTADSFAVPAGGALAVDRSQFSSALTKQISSHPLIQIQRAEIESLPSENQICVLATGPLTTECLAKDIKKLTGEEECHFFDAASPIITAESISFDSAFRASRYDKGDADYINCPMNKDQYLKFHAELIAAEQAKLKDFEKQSAIFFEGCLPIEELANRGIDTMRYGPLKPIGLWDPRWGNVNDKNLRLLKRAFAVVQLRQEDKAGKLWNLVGFQTNLKWGEQKRLIRMIPGLENAEFIRFGVMHKNTFLESPKILESSLQFKNRPNLLAAGQITGTEGYLPATAGGWLAGINAALLAKNLETMTLENTTMIGALINFVSNSKRSGRINSSKNFQPMPANFGLLPELEKHIKNKSQRYKSYRDRALKQIEKEKYNLLKLTNSR